MISRPPLLRFSKPFTPFRSGSWQGKGIWSFIGTPAVNGAPLLDCCSIDGKTAV